MDNSCELALIEMLKDDNKRLRNAGCKLAEAALRVVTEYDGVHRLMLATSEWTKAIANEGGRAKSNLMEDISEESYSWWFDNSFVDGVRMGPEIATR